MYLNIKYYKKTMKNKSIYLILAFILIGIFGVGGVLGATCNGTGNIINSTTISDGCTLDSAGTYVMSGETFYLNGSSTGVIQITADNVILEGNGSIIYYNQNGTDNSTAIYGLNLNNITIKNITLNDYNETGIQKKGINFEYCSYINITNNNFFINTNNNSRAIKLTICNNSNINLNTIIIGNTTNLGKNVYGIYIEGNRNKADSLDAYNNIFDNYINLSESTISEGILTERTNNNTIYNNILYTNSSEQEGGGIKLGWESYYSNVNNNSLNCFTEDRLCHGIFLERGASNNILYKNIITTWGNESYGISLDTQPARNNISENYISTYGADAHGIAFFQTTVNFDPLLEEMIYNNIFNNTININSSLLETTGIYLGSNNVSYNNVSYNIVYSNTMGINLINGPFNNNIENNNVYITKNSRRYAIKMQNTKNNVINGNYLESPSKQTISISLDASNNRFNSNTFNSTESYEIYLSSSDNNTFLNNIYIEGGIYDFYSVDSNNFSIKSNNNLYSINLTNFKGYVNVSNSEFSYLKGLTYINNISFYSLISALLTNSTSLCNGSTGLMTGNVNITLAPNQYCYVLDNFNLTEGVSRENSPMSITETEDNLWNIKSNISQEVIVDIIVNVRNCKTNGFTYKKQGDSKFSTVDKSQVTCSGNTAIISGLTIAYAQNSNELKFGSINSICDESDNSFLQAAALAGIMLTIVLIGSVIALLALSFNGVINLDNIKGMELQDVVAGILIIGLLFIVIATMAYLIGGNVCPAIT